MLNARDATAASGNSGHEVGVAGPGETLMSRIDASSVIDAPFPHLAISPVFQQAYYDELSSSFPDSATILGGRIDTAGNVAARLPYFRVRGNAAIPACWREFMDRHTSGRWWGEIVRVFGQRIRGVFPGIEERLGSGLGDCSVTPRGVGDAGSIQLDCQFVINTPGDRTVSVKTAHVDRASTIFSALFYLPDAGDTATGGDLDLYRWRRAPRFFGPRLTLPGDLEHVETIPYRPNSFACFVNHAASVHGVSPRSASRLPRRYINLIASVPFDAFSLPRLGVLERIVHFSQIRTQAMRSLGNDRKSPAGDGYGD